MKNVKPLAILVIFLIIATMILGNSQAVLGAKSDYLQVIENKADITQGYTWYRACNPTPFSFTPLTSRDFNVTWLNFSRGVSGWHLELRNNLSGFRAFNRMICFPYNESLGNGTVLQHNNCSLNQIQVYVEEYRWDDIGQSLVGQVFPANTCLDFRVVGAYPVAYRNSSIHVDNIVGFAGYWYPEYAAWLAAWSNRTAIYVNSTNGSRTNYPVGLFEGTGSAARSMCLNITGLVGKSSNDSDVRLLDNQTNATVPFEIISNTSSSVCVVFIANLTNNGNDSFYVYWNNINAPAITFASGFSSVGPETLTVGGYQFDFKGSIIRALDNFNFGRSVDGQELVTSVTSDGGVTVNLGRLDGGCQFTEINGSVVKWLNCTNSGFGGLYVFAAYNNFTRVIFNGFPSGGVNNDGWYSICGNDTSLSNSVHYRKADGTFATSHGGGEGVARAGIYACGKDRLNRKAFFYFNASQSVQNITHTQTRETVAPDSIITLFGTSENSGYSGNMGYQNIYMGLTGNSTGEVHDTWAWLEKKPIISFSSSEFIRINSAPTFTVNTSDDSNTTSMTDQGLNVTFNATINDADNDNVKLLICDSSGRSGTNCLNNEYCNVSFSSPGAKSCRFNTSSSSSVEYNWTSSACDNNGACIDGINGTFYITRPMNPAMYVNGSMVWNYSGLFSGPQTVEGFDINLKNDLAACQEVNGSCNISLTFYSESRGKLELAVINIQYDLYDTSPPLISSIVVSPNPAQVNSTINITVNATDNVNVTSVAASHKEAGINLTYNMTTGLWTGFMVSLSISGLYQLNITAIDSSNLTTINSTSKSSGSANGSSCASQCIQSGGAQADLMIYPEDITYSPSKLLENTTTTINATIYNFGNAQASNFNVELLIDGIEKASSTISLNGFNSTTIQFVWNATVGNHTVKLAADYTAIISEANETNNNASINISVEDITPPTITNIQTKRGSLILRVNITDNQNISSAVAVINGTQISLFYNQTSGLYEGNSTSVNPGTYPMTIRVTNVNGLTTTAQSSVTVYPDPIDLKISQEDLWFSMPSPFDNDNVIVYARIYNLGVNSSGNFTVELLLDDSSKANNTVSVSGDSNATTQFIWTASFGNHTVKIKVDSGNVISEINESNNEVSRSLNVSDAVPPNINQIMLSDIIYDGSTVSIKANVTDNVNLSKVNASINSSEIILGYNTSTKLYENTTIAPTTGTYALKLSAIDISGLASSLQENIIVHGSQADLETGTGEIELQPDNVTENNYLNISLALYDRGGADANGFKVELIIDGSSKTNNTLSIQKASKNTTAFTWNSTYGTHNLSVRIDPDNSIAESNESNNVKNITFFVLDITPPPLLSLTATPSNWTNQTTHNVSWAAVTDPNGMSRYEYRMNYGNWTNIWLNTSFTTHSSSEGVHTVYVRAIDTPGNIGTPSNVSTYIDLSPPNTPIIREWHTGDNWSNHTTPYLSWDDPGDEGSGILNFTVSVDEGQETNLGGNLSYHSQALASGTHTFKVKSYDSLNQASNWSNTITVYIDATEPGAPQVNSLTHPDNNTWYEANTPFFNLTPPTEHSGILGYHYIFDGNSSTSPDMMSFWTGNSTLNITGFGMVHFGINGSNESEIGLENGEWYLHVRAMDKAGNFGSNTSHFKVRINASKLGVTNTSLLNLSASKGLFKFDIRSKYADNLSNTSWRFDTKENYVINSTINFTIEPFERVFVFVQHNFSNSGIHNINVTASNVKYAGWQNYSLNIG